MTAGLVREFAVDTRSFSGNSHVFALRGIIDGVRDDHFMVILHNCGKTEKQVGELLGAGADALHVGNAVDIRVILDQVPDDIPVMGNLDPAGLFLSADNRTVYDRTTALLEATRAYPNHVLSSGCDLPPGVPWENVQAFFAAAADYNRRLPLRPAKARE